jgi:WD40 repeat protein
MKNFLRAGMLFVIFHFHVHASFAQGTCPGFGVNGIASSLESHSTRLNALTKLSNGKILAVGSYDDSGTKDILVARFNANGTPDLTFSYNGVRLYDINDHANDEALCVAIAGDGDILVGGISAGYGVVLKLDGTGDIVTSFGTNGKAQHEIIYSSVEDIMVSPEGNIYTVGKTFHTEI